MWNSRSPWQLAFRPRYIGRIRSGLAGGVTIAEDQFEMTIPFDGELIAVTGTFVDTPEILIGTRLLRKHRLTVDFVAATVQIERIISG